MRRRILSETEPQFILSLSRTSGTVSESASYTTFTILNNGETYTGNDAFVSSNQTWATVTNNSGVVRVNYTDNTSGSSRTATITITVQGQSATFTLTQTYVKIITSVPYDGTVDGYKYITLGGLKWAISNIGASEAYQDGSYFAWGETTNRTYFSWSSYKYATGTTESSGSYTKYNSSDGLTQLESSDDAAVANMGGGWRTPTKAEFTTLLNSINHEYAKYNNGSWKTEGRLLISKTNSNKYMFLPYSGRWNQNSSYAGNKNCFFSMTKDIGQQIRYFYAFNNNGNSLIFLQDQRPTGFTVRAVHD